MADLFTNEIATGLTVGGTVGILAGSIIIGLFITMVYISTHRKDGYSESFVISLIMLPPVIAIIILLIGNNVARAFSLVGAFSLIRFRSAPGDSKDITYAFFALGVGLACGMGYIAYAALFAIILCGVMVILKATRFGINKNKDMRLKITIPEDLDYQGIFNETLNEYTASYKLIKVKTSEFGSLFELAYDVILKNDIDTKRFIDDLRCKNGNLTIVLGVKENKEPATF